MPTGATKYSDSLFVTLCASSAYSAGSASMNGKAAVMAGSTVQSMAHSSDAATVHWARSKPSTLR